MSKINNLVVENLSPEMGARIIKAFNAMGVYTHGYNGEVTGNFRFYGVINGVFDNHSQSRLTPETRIITIEELENMAYGNKYPQVMYVGDEDLQEAINADRRRAVFMVKNGEYLAWRNAKTIEDSENISLVQTWKYAWPIPEEKPETNLKAEIEALKSVSSGLIDEITKLRAENDKLRQAVRHIKNLDI